MSIIEAPFTEEQVEILNDYQKSGNFHQFTCCSDKNSPSCKRRLSNAKRSEKQQEYLKKDIEWLREEVRKLDKWKDIADDCVDWQLANILASKDIPYSDENEGILTASTEGWVCPCGEYKQYWAHDFMAKNKNNEEN